jgi:hypothetical protein
MPSVAEHTFGVAVLVLLVCDLLITLHEQQT